jgi:hypothetical protein
MATDNPKPDASPSPSPDGAVLAAETADLLRRYLSGDNLTPKEFGKVGAHYHGLGQPVPKEQRSKAINARRVGPAVAASAILADNPPLVPEAPQLPPSPAEQSANATLLCDLLGSLLDSADKTLRQKAERVGRKVGADEKTLARMTEKPVISERAKGMIIKPLPTLAAKYGVGLDYVPEASVLTGLAEVGLNVSTLLGELNELEKLADEREKRRREEAKANP